MTKAEFNALFDDCYRETLSLLSDRDAMQKRLQRAVDENGKFKNEAVLGEAVRLSFDLTASLLRSVLAEVLDLSD